MNLTNMNNTNAFYKLSLKRREIEDNIESYSFQIKDIREQAKKLKKGSDIRNGLMQKATEIENCEEYKILKAELKLMNFCINNVF